MECSKHGLRALGKFNVLLMVICTLSSAPEAASAKSNNGALLGSQAGSGAVTQVPKRGSAVSAAAVGRILPARLAGSADLEHSPSLETVQRYARDHNPSVRAAFYAWRAAYRRITEQRSYQNPMISYMPDTGNLAETRAGPQTNGIGFSQAIPFPGKLTLKGEVAGEQSQAARQKLDAVTQELERRVWGAYADVYLADRSLQVNAATTRLLDQFQEIAQVKYRVGSVPEQDVIQAQEELSRLATQRVDFQARRQSARGALNSLLNRPPWAPIGSLGQLGAKRLDIPLARLIDEADASRPELRAQGHVVAGSEDALKLARMGYLPDLKIGGQYIGVGNSGVPGFNHDGHDIWAATIGFSVPIWFDRVKARIDEAGAQVMAQQFRQRDLADVVADQVQQAYHSLMAAARNEEIYRTTLLPQSQERVAAARAGYQTGIVDFLTLIDALKSFEDARLAHYRSISQYQRAAADLERAVGRTVPGISK